MVPSPHPPPDWFRETELDTRVTRVESRMEAIGGKVDALAGDVRNKFDAIFQRLDQIGRPNYQVVIGAIGLIVTMGVAVTGGVAAIATAVFQGRIAVLEKTDYAHEEKLRTHTSSGGHVESQVRLGIIDERIQRLDGDIKQLDDKLQLEIEKAVADLSQRSAVLERRVQVETYDRIQLAMSLLQAKKGEGLTLLPPLSTEPTQWK